MPPETKAIKVEDELNQVDWASQSSMRGPKYWAAVRKPANTIDKPIITGINDSTKFYTDNGHVVYGGGGIIPDIYVPVDTTALGNESYVFLRQLLPSFVFRYVENHPDFFTERDLDYFVRNFSMDDQLLQELLEYAESQDVSFDETELVSARPRLAEDMKVRMAKQLYDDLGAYTVQNKQDETVQKALEVLQKPNPLASARKD